MIDWMSQEFRRSRIIAETHTLGCSGHSLSHSWVEDVVLLTVLRSSSHTRRPLWKTTELLFNYTPQVRIPSSEFLHLSVLLLLQFGDETLQDWHFKLDILCHIIRDFFSEVFLHEENLADLLTWTLNHSQHQRIVISLQFHTLSTCMDEVEGKIIWAVFNFKLVEENSKHLRCPHAAVDPNISHRAERRSKH